jgi:hypothetical protein
MEMAGRITSKESCLSTLKIVDSRNFLCDVEKGNSIFHAAVSTDVEGGGGDGGGWFTHVCFEQVRLLQPYTILVSAIDARPHLDEY